ncbi:MAG TPA: hypothetical protein VF323_00665 [Candidatus Limnocylindrales bacterium]
METLGAPERPASVVTVPATSQGPDLTAAAAAAAAAANVDRDPAVERASDAGAQPGVPTSPPPDAPQPLDAEPRLAPPAGAGASAPVAAMSIGVGRVEAVDGRPITEAPLAGDAARLPGCTSPQLRRFIKSRAYIPMHELRRRFAIDGPEDDVAAIDVDGTRLYVGLPEREGRLLGELLRAGDVGAELSHDPVTPIIVGVYPMRPVPRS